VRDKPGGRTLPVKWSGARAGKLCFYALEKCAAFAPTSLTGPKTYLPLSDVKEDFGDFYFFLTIYLKGSWEPRERRPRF
jgi:hypothetical protein